MAISDSGVADRAAPRPGAVGALDEARRGEPFFLIMGLVLAVVVVAGFGSSILMRPGGIATVAPLLHVHGAVFFGWFVVFCLQARLIAAGNVRLHMTLGKASVVLAAAIVVLGYVVMRGAYARPDFSIAGLPPAPSMMFPFTDVVNFVIAYGLALANRRTPAAHKRLMLLAGILIIDPAAARLVFALGGPPPMIIALELALLGALIVYDLITRRRPHWASLLGLGLYIAALVAKFAMAGHPGWAEFVERLLG